MSLCFGNIFIVNHLAEASSRDNFYGNLKPLQLPQNTNKTTSAHSYQIIRLQWNVARHPVIVSRLWSNKPYSKNLCSARHNNQYHNEGFCDFTSHSVQALSGQNKNLTFLSYLHLIRVMANTGSQLTDSEDRMLSIMFWGDGNINMDVVGKFPIISRYFPLLNNYPIMSKL